MASRTVDGKGEEGTETRKVTKEEAAFILGQGGKTKAKLCAVSGAHIDLVDGRGGEKGQGSSLLIRGTSKQRAYARKYVEFVVAQRLGPVKIEDPSAHDDLTLLTVPADTVSFITGKQGSFLRLVEEEWHTLLFFLQVNPKNPPQHVDPNHTERLAIFGPERLRRGAQLKVMAAIEMKTPGYFSKSLSESESPEPGFATDTVVFREEDLSYALGKKGETRKKLARASGCIVEYVGRIAFFCGIKEERHRAKEYTRWLLSQRVGEQVEVDHKTSRQDMTVVSVPTSCIGFVTGHKGLSLRAIEEETGTFCFIDGAAEDTEESKKPVLIFGRAEDRRMAENLVWDRISQKYDETSLDGYGDWGYGGKSRKGKGKGKGKDSDYDKGKGKGGRYGGEKGGSWAVREANQGPDPEKLARKDVSSDSVAITDDDAAFLMGPAGKTKKKIAAVSGPYLELKTNELKMTGTKEEREKAKKYIQLVMAQRVGPVMLEDMEQHDDLSVVEVPAEAVSFVTGKQGSFLRLVEEEFGTLLFLIDFNKSSRRDQLERLAVFGPLRERRGAELKVMAAIEMKQPGYFTWRDQTLPMEDPTEGFATDRMTIEEDDYSYALGKGGATRKKIARASGCVIEYIGRLAYLSGTRKERVRAREYLGWLFRQRVGPVEVDYSNREDVAVLPVPKDCVGFVTGHKGMALRTVEDATGTFCFIEGGRSDPHRDPKPLLIFGGNTARKSAEEMLKQRIDQKLVQGWVHEEGGNDRGYSGNYGYSDNRGYGDRYGGGNGWGGSYGRGGDWDGGYGGGSWEAHGYGGSGGHSNSGWQGGSGYGKGGDRGLHGSGPRKPPAGRASGYNGDDRAAGAAPNGGAEPSPAAAGGEAPPIEATKGADNEDEDDGAWGDWGGSSDEGEGAAATPAAAASPAKGTPNAGSATSRGGWNPYHVGPYMAASPSRGGVSGSSPPRAGEDLELPPQLLHEEAWPELGGPPSKGRK